MESIYEMIRKITPPDEAARAAAKAVKAVKATANSREDAS